MACPPHTAWWCNVSQQCSPNFNAVQQRNSSQTQHATLSSIHYIHYHIHRVTTLQTLWNSLTFPWQCAALMPMLSVMSTFFMSIPAFQMVSNTTLCATTVSSSILSLNNSLLMEKPPSTAALPVSYEGNVKLLNTHMNANIHLVMNSFGTLFHDKIFPWHFPDNSLTVNNIPDISLTSFKFPDISRFSRQVVTLYTAHQLHYAPLIRSRHMALYRCVSTDWLQTLPYTRYHISVHLVPYVHQLDHPHHAIFRLNK